MINIKGESPLFYLLRIFMFQYPFKTGVQKYEKNWGGGKERDTDVFFGSFISLLFHFTMPQTLQKWQSGTFSSMDTSIFHTQYI